MDNVERKNDVIQGIIDKLNSFEFEYGPATDYAGYHMDCEFAGCDRQATYYISSPNYDRRYNNIYGFACEIHVGVQTLYYGYKFADKELDQRDCKVCEASAFACECDPKEAVGAVQRKADPICPICGCDPSEHNWEAHTMEMKAASYE